MRRYSNTIIAFITLYLTTVWSWKPLGSRPMFPDSVSEKLKLKLNLPRAIASLSILFAISVSPLEVSARPEGVNRPDLLPSGPVTSVIDTANFLTKGQEKKVLSAISDLEKSTGYKLRLLCQSYPNTPGLAIKEYWGIDDNTVLLVADRGEGFNRKGIPTNIMNLNIGRNLDTVLPAQFWTRLTNKLGNQPYVKENGEDVAVLNAVEAITYCLANSANSEVKPCTDLPFSI
jgi:hypothetical protein